MKFEEVFPTLREYTGDDLLEFLLRQIKTITVDNANVDAEVVSATIIYKNGGETDCRLPKNLLDCLMDRLNGLFHKQNRYIIKDKDSFLGVEEENNTPSNKITPENLRSRLSKLREDLDLDESIDLLAFLLDGVWEALLKRKKQIKGGSKDDKEGLEMANHDRCGDNRFKVIEKAKEALLESTNIESSPEEMAVLDNFLFRCWQMGWLNKYEEGERE